jgi:hypothetical protein
VTRTSPMEPDQAVRRRYGEDMAGAAVIAMTNRIADAAVIERS